MRPLRRSSLPRQVWCWFRRVQLRSRRTATTTAPSRTSDPAAPSVAGAWEPPSRRFLGVFLGVRFGRGSFRCWARVASLVGRRAVLANPRDVLGGEPLLLPSFFVFGGLCL